LGWENATGWLACGGDNGTLKTLKLDQNDVKTKWNGAQKEPENQPNPSSVSQTLEGHSGPMVKIVWNRMFNKLTTADANGMIIVWVSYKGMWYEEMVNDRAKSQVSDLRWNKRGDKIVIAYMDGTLGYLFLISLSHDTSPLPKEIHSD
jgi:WD repeat-containing protein 35